MTNEILSLLIVTFIVGVASASSDKLFKFNVIYFLILIAYYLAQIADKL